VSPAIYEWAKQNVGGDADCRLLVWMFKDSPTQIPVEQWRIAKLILETHAETDATAKQLIALLDR
jgi:hypothetical protein